ncbi:MAG: putative selenium-dependent hydroxylase accessory protein YqeC [Chloroflexi bacterium]|nr:putative selenium-dependent hydroxylase accessory protein YqeC [Chloroflexota bacterium]
MRFREALNLKPHEIISLVGGGGKTTLMFALARELASSRQHVVTTTTTKILESEPSHHGSPMLIIENDERKVVTAVVASLTRFTHITLASERLPDSGKIKGIGPRMVDELARLEQISYIIVEADGAAHRSLKAPNATEPVISQSSTLVIPVVGIDSLGTILSDDTVFRPQIVSQLTALALGDTITEDTIATLVTHTAGIAKGSPGTARIVPFINKMDIEEDSLSTGTSLAMNILRRRHPQVDSVVLGQAQAADPVVQVISAQAAELART